MAFVSRYSMIKRLFRLLEQMALEAKQGYEVDCREVNWQLEKMRHRVPEKAHVHYAALAIQEIWAARDMVDDHKFGPRSWLVWDELVAVQRDYELPPQTPRVRGPRLNAQKPRNKGLRAHRLGLAG